MIHLTIYPRSHIVSLPLPTPSSHHPLSLPPTYSLLPANCKALKDRRYIIRPPPPLIKRPKGATIDGTCYKHWLRITVVYFASMIRCVHYMLKQPKQTCRVQSKPLWPLHVINFLPSKIVAGLSYNSTPTVLYMYVCFYHSKYNNALCSSILLFWGGVVG